MSNISVDFRPLLSADDTTLTCVNDDESSLRIKCNEELDKSHNWTVTNQLSVNQTETNFMFITNRACNINFTIKHNDVPLQFESTTQFLGVFLDHELNFDVYMKQVCQKVSKALGILHRMKDLLTIKVLRTLYHSCVWTVFYMLMSASDATG